MGTTTFFLAQGCSGFNSSFASAECIVKEGRGGGENGESGKWNRERMRGKANDSKCDRIGYLSSPCLPLPVSLSLSLSPCLAQHNTTISWYKTTMAVCGPGDGIQIRLGHKDKQGEGKVMCVRERKEEGEIEGEEEGGGTGAPTHHIVQWNECETQTRLKWEGTESRVGLCELNGRSPPLVIVSNSTSA